MSDKSTIPTKEELAELPSLALTAFAARCARRVQPLFDAATREGVPKEHSAAIERAIRYSADYAAGAVLLGPPAALAAEAAKAAMAANAVWAVAAVFAANTAQHAADTPVGLDVCHQAAATADAAATWSATSPDEAARKRGTIDAPAPARAAALAAMRRDFELLRAATRLERWTEKTPVRQEFFGPLWPEGVPEGWPAEQPTSEGCELIFEVNVADDIRDQELIEMAQRLARRADTLHRAYGGHGLKVKGVEVFGEVPVHEGVTT